MGELDGCELDERTVAALRLVDVFTSPQPEVTDEQYAELRRFFDDGEILELAVAVSLASGWQRVIEAFGIRPDGLAPPL